MASTWVAFDDVIGAYEAQSEPEWERLDPPGVVVPTESEPIRRLRRESRVRELDTQERRDYLSGAWLGAEENG